MKRGLKFDEENGILAAHSHGHGMALAVTLPVYCGLRLIVSVQRP
jgi:hypothetical protein